MALTVNQWVPAAHRGDAIGDSARRVEALLRGMGFTSHLYAMTIDDDLRDVVRPFDHPEARGGDVTIFHFALPSPMTPQFASLPRGPGAPVPQHHAGALLRAVRPEPVPPRAPRPAGPGDARRPRGPGAGRLRVQPLGARADGIRPDRRDADRDRHRPHHRRPPRARRSRRSWTTASTTSCSSGASCPNKKIEDYVRLAEQYKRYVNVDYRFVFVGRCDGVPRYYAAVRALMARVRDPAGPVHLHRPGAGRGPGGVLPAWRASTSR